MSQRVEIIKLVLLGDEFDGKKQFLHKYMGEGFKQSYDMTIGSDFAVKQLELDGEKIVFRVWELKGQIRFQSVREVYYEGTRGIILVFNLKDGSTFESLPFWITEAIENNENKIVPMILVGIQLDFNRTIKYESGVDYANSLSNWCKYQVPYFEINLETDELECDTGYTSMDEGFEHLARLILRS